MSNTPKPVGAFLLGVLALVTGLLVAPIEMAHAALSPIGCPSWDTFFPTPEHAATNYFKHTSLIPAQCRPIYSQACEVGANGPSQMQCWGFSANPACSGLEPFGKLTSGSGPQEYGHGITIQSFNGKSHCAVYGPEGYTRGDPNSCPAPCKGPSCTPGPCGGRGNPVNIAQPNKYQREIDVPLGSGTPLGFERHYNSAVPMLRHHIGAGWSHTWTRFLFKAADRVQAYRPDGKYFSFFPSGSAWAPPADVPLELTELPSGEWELKTSLNETETYSAEGKLMSVVMADGQRIIFTHSDGTDSGPAGSVAVGTTDALPYGLLIRAEDQDGRAMTFQYFSSGNIAKVTAADGKVFEYTYNTAGDLITVHYPGTESRNYHYNESAHVSGATYLVHLLTGISDENGQRFATYKYQTDRRPLSTEHAGTVNKHQFTYGAGSTSYVDPLGTTRSASYTAILGVNRITSNTRTCVGCGGSSTEYFTYDSNANVASHKNFNGALACYSHNSRNLQISRVEALSGAGTCTSPVTTPETRTTTTEWHPTWRLPKRIAEPLKITIYAYHGETGVSCAPAGAATTLLCSKSVHATTDADGSQAFAASYAGTARISTWNYNLYGRVLSADGPRSDVTDTTTFTYYTVNDIAGKYRAGDRANSSNALGHVTQFTEYDGAGRLLKSVDPNGLETILAYSDRGWIVSRKIGTATAGYEETVYEYDLVGSLKKVTNPDGSFVEYTYDGAHRLTDLVDGLGNRIHYTLDNMGNRTSEEAFDSSNTLSRAHSRVIDGLNRIAKEIGGTNPSTQITESSHDAMGNVTAILDALGRTTTNEFDALDRLKAVKDPFNGPSNPTTYQYNRQGVLTQVTDPTGLATSYTVNGHGETVAQSSPDTGGTSFTFDAASNMVTRTDARGMTATYTHDALNRVTQIVYPDETVSYTWDTCTHGKGRLCSISDNSGTTSYAFDLWGRVLSKSQTVAGLVQAISYAYNAAGQLASVTTPSGRVVTHGYANARPVSVSVDGTNVLNSVVYEPFGPSGGWIWGNSTSGTPNTHTRIHDLDYRTTRVTSDLPQAGSQPYFDKQLTWDAISRITSIDDLANAALDAAYGYDSLDRVTSANQGAAAWGYTYNGIGDRLSTVVGGASTTYGYFSGTHRLQSLSGAQSKSYTFDAAGNMTSDGTTTWVYGGNNRPTQAGNTTFLINALGQRVKKTTGSNAVRFVYDEAGRLWGEYDAAGALIQETIWLDDLPIATLRDNGSGGTVLYNYFRDYDPSLGRYTQSDPIGLEAGLNTYGYVSGQPLTYKDVFGLIGAAGGAGGVGGGALGGAGGAAGAGAGADARGQALLQLIDLLKQLCKRKPDCNPPKGTQCWQLESGHKHKGLDPHYHTWQMNQDGDGDCFWNKMRSASKTHSAPPAGMAPCETYPSWVLQVKGR